MHMFMLIETDVQNCGSCTFTTTSVIIYFENASFTTTKIIQNKRKQLANLYKNATRNCFYHSACSTTTLIIALACSLCSVVLTSSSSTSSSSSSSLGHDGMSTREGRLRLCSRRLPFCRSPSTPSPSDPFRVKYWLFTGATPGWWSSRSSALILRKKNSRWFISLRCCSGFCLSRS